MTANTHLKFFVTLISLANTNLFPLWILSVAPFSFYRPTHNPHTTQNSSNRSDEGLTLEKSAFKLFTVANLCFQLSDNNRLPCYTLPPTQLHSSFIHLYLEANKTGVYYDWTYHFLN